MWYSLNDTGDKADYMVDSLNIKMLEQKEDIRNAHLNYF